MKWFKPEYGSARIVKKFLIIPKQIDNEVRWLETVCIKQYYQKWGWRDSYFINKKDGVINE